MSGKEGVEGVNRRILDSGQRRVGGLQHSLSCRSRVGRARLRTPMWEVEGCLVHSRSVCYRRGPAMTGLGCCPIPGEFFPLTGYGGVPELSDWRGFPAPVGFVHSSGYPQDSEFLGKRGCLAAAESVHSSDSSEVQLCDEVFVVYGDALPFPYGRVGVPVGFVPPVRAVRGVVEGDQRSPVR